MATNTFLFLDKPKNIEGVTWPAGPRVMVDAAWTRMLISMGARVLTEKQYEELINPAPKREVEAAQPATSAAPTEPPVPEPVTAPEKEAAHNGADDASDSRGDQISAANSSRSSRSRRPYRRVS